MMYRELCTEFYDLDKQFAAADEIEFYKSLLDKESIILEPMCGSGRLLIPLIEAGYNIHGVDNSTFMLTSCKKRAEILNLNPTLFEATIATMSLPHKYTTILIPLGSYQLLYPRTMAFAALQNLKKHLSPDGILILDLFIPWDALSENNAEELTEKEVNLPNTGKIIHQACNIANKYEQYIYSESIYKKIINNQVVAEEDEQMYICWYYRYEMQLILEKYGFRNISYQEAYFRNENHMIFVAEN